MRIVHGLESYPPDAVPSVVALGVFDGIHLGHRAILGTAVDRGKARGGHVVACTFDRHPMEVLQPTRAPIPITTLEERLELIAETGVDVSLVLAFTPQLATVEPEVFVKDVVVGRLHAQEVVVGYNHTFGWRSGDAALLHAVGRPWAGHPRRPPLLFDGLPSLLDVRKALRREIAAGPLVTRTSVFLGTVTRGAARGRTIGFPTANLTRASALVPTGSMPAGPSQGAVQACRDVGVPSTSG